MLTQPLRFNCSNSFTCSRISAREVSPISTRPERLRVTRWPHWGRKKRSVLSVTTWAEEWSERWLAWLTTASTSSRKRVTPTPSDPRILSASCKSSPACESSVQVRRTLARKRPPFATTWRSLLWTTAGADIIADAKSQRLCAYMSFAFRCTLCAASASVLLLPSSNLRPARQQKESAWPSCASPCVGTILRIALYLSTDCLSRVFEAALPWATAWLRRRSPQSRRVSMPSGDVRRASSRLSLAKSKRRSASSSVARLARRSRALPCAW
mmetsp:Transcript_3125/g.10919  ORF Transcript_3125/g.10919 Transcript_3125/m.10919 type:complete len:269 (-) Transcript_3125:2186-2992(-)